MKASRCIFTAVLTFMFCFFCSSSVMAASFPDIEGHWAEDSIEEAVSKGFFNGYEDGTFQPNGKITRAEMAAIYSRMLQLQNAASNNFTDLGDGWYNEDVLKNVYAGTLQGYPDQTFRPDHYITRQEAAKMMGNCLPNNATGSGASVFVDQDMIQSWAIEEIALCADKGYFVGDLDHRFNPNTNITRAEAAVILVRMSNGETIVPETSIDMNPSTVLKNAPTTANISNQIRSNGIVTGNHISLTLNNVSLLGQSTIDGDIDFTTTKIVRLNLSGSILMNDSTVSSANFRGIITSNNSSFGTIVVGGTSTFHLQGCAIHSMIINAPANIFGTGSSIRNVQQNVSNFSSDVPIDQKDVDIPATTNAVTLSLSYDGGSEKVVTLAYGANDSLWDFLYTATCDPDNESLLESQVVTPFNNNLDRMKNLKVNEHILWSDAGWNEVIELFDGTSISTDQLSRMKPDFDATSITLSDLQDFIGGLNMLYEGGLSTADRSKLVSNLDAMDLTTTTTSGATVDFTLSCDEGTLTDNKAIGTYFINHILWNDNTIDEFFEECGDIVLDVESSGGNSTQISIEKTTI
jgi:hypothetical protein